MQSGTKKRVGILRGGAGEHYAPSLKHGGALITHISEKLSDKFKTFDILIDKDHVWHINGLPVSPTELMNKVDVVWNTSHHSFSSILESLSIPTIGASTFAATIESSRDMLREHMKKIGVNMPRHMLLPLYQKDFDGPRERYAIKKAKEVHAKFGGPWIVKSFTPDSNMGVHLAQTFDELVAGIEDGVKHEKSILVEEFISGKVASVHSLNNFRGQETYIFPVDNVFGNLSSSEKETLMTIARDLHNHMAAKHYIRSSFILNKRGKAYLLDISSTLDPRSDSYFSKVCESVGAKVEQVVEHIIGNAV